MSERALSIVPGGSTIGVAVLEGSERLVDWRVARLRTRTVTAQAALFRRLAYRFEPTLVVVEDVAGSRRGTRACRVIDRVTSISHEAGWPVVAVSGGEVSQHFTSVATDRYELAHALANFFPELAPRVPQKPFPGDREDPRMSMFIAVANALVVLRRREATITDSIQENQHDNETKTSEEASEERKTGCN